MSSLGKEVKSHQDLLQDGREGIHPLCTTLLMAFHLLCSASAPHNHEAVREGLYR